MRKILGAVLGFAVLMISSTSFAGSPYVYYSDGSCGLKGHLAGYSAEDCARIINLRGTVTYSSGYYYVGGYILMNAPRYSTTYSEFLGRKVDLWGTRDASVKGVWIDIIELK